MKNTHNPPASAPEARSWDLFARDRGDHFSHPGIERWVRLFGGSDPVVPVRLTESATGSYWGWLETGADAPTMVWPSQHQLEMCFPYGSAAAVKSGSGRIVRLKIGRR